MTGRTPLHAAAHWGQIDCLKTLLRNGANPNLRSNSGKTALDAALHENKAECAAYLKTVMNVVYNSPFPQFE